MSEVLSDSNFEIVTPKQLGISGSPVEDGDTYEANALIKARWFYEQSNGVPTLAGDSGIEIEALQGELGKHTRRWGAGPEATDEEWITYFLDRMSREHNKRAAFVCYLAYIDPEGNEHVFNGRCEGVITQTLEAAYLPGLPISACFKPDGYTSVFSALTIEQKNSTSHRGKAVHSFKKFNEKLALSD